MLARLAAFIRLSRLTFLAGGFAGGGLGTALAAYERGWVDWPAYAVAQGTITSFHLMTHYANDYFDRAADRLTIPTPYSGGSGVLVSGALAPPVALRAALVCAGCGLAATTALAFALGRGPAAALGLGIAALAWGYSAPPLRLLARGLGELDTAVVVAVLVPLCAFAAQGMSLDARAIATTLPGAAAMLAMMLAVQSPDLVADAAGGKRNLLVRLGAARARPLGAVFVLLAYLALAMALMLGAPPAVAVLELLSLPVGIGLARTFLAAAPADPAGDEALAARGVAFFFLVTVFALLAYAAAPLAPHGAAATAATIAAGGTVMTA